MKKLVYAMPFYGEKYGFQPQGRDLSAVKGSRAFLMHDASVAELVDADSRLLVKTVFDSVGVSPEAKLRNFMLGFTFHKFGALVFDCSVGFAHLGELPNREKQMQPVIRDLALHLDIRNSEVEATGDGWICSKWEITGKHPTTCGGLRKRDPHVTVPFHEAIKSFHKQHTSTEIQWQRPGAEFGSKIKSFEIYLI